MSNAIYQKVLTKDEIYKAAPAVFTQQPKDTTSKSHYLFIPTEKILTGLIDNGFKVVSALQQGARTDAQKPYAKHVLHLMHESQLQGDALTQGEFPLLRIQNSHDAKSSFQVDTGVFRLVCSNGIVMPKNDFNSARIVHNQSTTQESIEAAYRILTNADKELEIIDAMKSIELNSDERMLLANTSKNLIFDSNVIELNEKNGVNLEQKILMPRRYEDKKTDLWTTFNVIQENAIKGGIKILRESENGRYRAKTGERVSRAKTRAVKSIDADKKLNVQLMTLAQEFAKLKGLNVAA